MFESSTSKTLNKMWGLVICGILFKYQEQLTVINLIISKWSKLRLNASLSEYYKSQRDGLIIFK